MRAAKRSVLVLSLLSVGAFVWSYIEWVRSGQSFNNIDPLKSLLQASGGLLLILVGLLLWFIAWCVSLVRSSQLGRWGWFTLMFLVLLFTGPAGTLFYGLLGPVRRRR